MPQLYKTTTGQMFHAGLIAIVPVGLPARGKTFMSQKLARYFRWLGVKTMVFNVGAYRRAKMGANIPHNFFDPSNERNRKRRLEIADEVLDTMVEFLVSGRGQVGIYDTTTTISPERRQHVLERLTSRGIETIFIETIVEDESIIESNIRAVKLNMPDYIGWDPDDAVKDFFQRIEHHRDVYKEISDPELSYVRVLNIGLEGVKIFANRVQGYLQVRLHSEGAK